MASARWSSADVARKATAPKQLTTNPRSTAPSQTPPAPLASPEPRQTTPKKASTTVTALKPRYQVASYPGFEGTRVVFVGLTQEQADRLAEYAQGVGIQQQN